MGHIKPPNWAKASCQKHLPFDLLRPYPEGDLESWRVSDKVGDTKNDWAELTEPIPEDTPKTEKKPKRKKLKKELPPNGLFD